MQSLQTWESDEPETLEKSSARQKKERGNIAGIDKHTLRGLTGRQEALYQHPCDETQNGEPPIAFGRWEADLPAVRVSRHLRHGGVARTLSRPKQRHRRRLMMRWWGYLKVDTKSSQQLSSIGVMYQNHAWNIGAHVFECSFGVKHSMVNLLQADDC